MATLASVVVLVLVASWCCFIEGFAPAPAVKKNYFHHDNSVCPHADNGVPSSSYSLSPVLMSSSRCIRSKSKIWLSLPNTNDEEVDDDGSMDTIAEDEDEDNNDSQEQQAELTVPQRARVLAYRSTICVSALLLSAIAVFGSDFMAGTGLSGTSTIVSNSEMYLPVFAGCSLLLAPVDGDIARLASRFLSIVTIATGGAMIVLDSNNNTMAFALGILTLLVVNAREIYYFGISYKLEAVVALVSLPILLIAHLWPAYESLSSGTAAVSALAVGVLAFGKVFEPCGEDYFKSNTSV